MTATYEEILQRMKETFSELSGFQADDASDIGIRLRVLAGELFSMGSHLDWIKKQMFVQTATNEQLDLHAADRGLLRRQASKSSGTLTFSRVGTIGYDIQIPQGTICSTAGTNAPRYVTTQAVTLANGETTVSAPAQSVEGGSHTNTSANTITVLVTPPAGITMVTNGLPFTGGTDSEPDEELRKRIIDRCRNIPNGTNAAFYKNCAMSYNTINSVNVIPRANGVGTVDIYVATKGGVPTDALVAQIQSDINNLKEINVNATVKKPELVEVLIDAVVEIEDGYEFSVVESACEESLMEYFNSLCIGENYLTAAAGNALFNTEGVKNYYFNISSGDADLAITQTQLAVVDSITITQG